MSNAADPKVLAELAAYDRKVFHHSSAIAAGRRQEEKLRAEEVEAASAVAETRQRLEAAQGENRRLEKEADEMRRQAKHHGGRLNEIQDSREWRALNDEVRYLQRQAENRDEKALENMEAIEKLEAEYAEAEREFNSRKEQISNKRNLIVAEREEHEKQLAVARAEREEFLGQVPAATMRFYERRAKRQDMPVVWMREGSCSHCHAKLTPQGINDVRGGQRLVTCESCGRLVVPPDAAMLQSFGGQ